MPSGLSSGLGPWILATLGLSVIIACIAAFRAWRDARFSPYYLLRRQAAERGRTRTLIAFFLLIFFCGAAGFLATRPPLVVTITLPAFLGTATPVPPAPTFPQPTRSLTPAPSQTPTLHAPPTRPAYTPTSSPTPTVGLPEGFLTPVTPVSTPAPDAAFGPITLASQIVAETGLPLVITDTFRTGHFTVYAVFTYTAMTPGVAWTHLWLHNTVPFRGEMALWSLQPAGRAFVFVNPNEGWPPGDYTVELFIGEQLQQSAEFRVLP